MIKENQEITGETYIPDTEEIQDALGFLMSCSESDLVESWTRISSEWNLDSVSRVHKELCTSGRIHDLVEGFLRL